MNTVRDFGERLGLTATIQRAVSYDPARLGGVWFVPVKWNNALRTSAGRANAKIIELHPGLEIAGRVELVKTFLHELAHTLDFTLRGTGGHGVGWIIQMARLGADPVATRHHSLAPCMQSADPREIAKLLTVSDFD